MCSIAAWNVRGLNRSLKQTEVRHVMSENHLQVCAILESHVDISSLFDVCKRVFRKWEWTSNGNFCDKGTRIILGWDSDAVDVMVLSQSSQVMHAQVYFKIDKKMLFCSFVYAKNCYMERRNLWNDLCIHKQFIQDKPWVILGDFNVSLTLEDSYAGVSKINTGMRDFKECINQIEVLDINSSGLHYTWNQKPKKGIGILKKLDRIMGNMKFIDLFRSSYAIFQPYRVSDHSPCVLKLPSVTRWKPKPFKFANFLVNKRGFKDAVKEAWGKKVRGNKMFCVVKKLRAAKPALRKLLYDQGNLHAKVTFLRSKLDSLQSQVDGNPSDLELREMAAACLKNFEEAVYDEECFLKQKAKIEWLNAGDSNTAYFHRSLKCRNHRGRIERVKNKEGVVFEGSSVAQAFVDHYQNFLGSISHIDSLSLHGLFTNKLSMGSANEMVKPVTNEEIKQAIFSIGNNRAPGPDGYSAAFFKGAWDVVGNEVCGAIRDFFMHTRMLRDVNHTIIALIPKVSTPDSVTDFRPIACCNVLYKCITKIISNRIKVGLDEVVSINQSAFIPGRRISDNILLTQELMHNYHLNKGTPRCAFKVDIQKAYDTVSWDFLHRILVGFGFHDVMVNWIMECVTTASFSICINGDIHGYFDGKRGLRQGDPMSPYLFTLVMEVLTLLLHRAVRQSLNFRFHALCEKQRLINLCFADDLFLFSRGDVRSSKIIMDSLEEFKEVSGLVPSVAKSTVFFGNVADEVRQAILSLMPFEEGKLPVRYLGVPLISTKLLYSDCKGLVEKMENRIDDWKNKSLSFAGRLQLVNSVLSSLHVYWASVFILPSRIIKELEQKMRKFLWRSDNEGKYKSKASWNSVCLPKLEGGLGIRRLTDVNKALMAYHIWSILSNRNSLWVQWVQMYKLKGRNFWEVQLRGNVSWGWRKILKIRDTFRPFIWKLIGDGMDTNAWSDRWNDFSPLRGFITPRIIARSGFDLDSNVAELVEFGTWKWPVAWYDLFPVLINIPMPIIDPNKRDALVWRAFGKDYMAFSAAIAWDSIRVRQPEVNWAKIVWFNQCIPRHAFHMWQVFRRKLKTQDRLKEWDATSLTNLNLMCCSLCSRGPDSHDHLFFDCVFSKQVWNQMRSMFDMDQVDSSWNNIVDYMVPRANKRSASAVIEKIGVAAISYFIWQERNSRLFTADRRTPCQLREVIMKTITLKIITLKFKKTETKNRVWQKWKISGIGDGYG